MRILHVVPTYYPAVRYGGPIVSVHGLCRALAARGHEVEVFTTNVDGPGTLDVPTDRAVPLDGVSVHYFPSAFPRIYWSPAMRRALRARAASFDVIHSHALFLWPGLAAARAARDARVPYLISPRGMLVPELIRARGRLRKTLWLQLLERRALAGAAAIHFTSEREREDALRTSLPLPNPLVIANGVDLAPRPDVPREPSTLLFLGRLSWKKGIDRVIEALASLPDVEFIVAGNDEEGLTPQLQRIAAEFGVAERVRFTGPVYGDEKTRLLASVTLFVLLSDSENFGNSAVEALAMETPVVLSRGVAIAEEVAEAGASIIGMDGIPPLLQDRERLQMMGRAGRDLVERRFSWEQVAATMESAYRSAIGGHH